jgi:hypothetical protein
LREFWIKSHARASEYRDASRPIRAGVQRVY